MAGDDVHPGEMDALTPEELEYALENPDELLVHPVALTLGDLRRSLHAIESPTPGPALAEFLEVTPFRAPSGAEESIHVTAPASVRVARKNKEKTMIGSLTAIAASAAGKVLLGSAAAAAAFGAAQATGIVDVSPDDRSAEVVAGVESDVEASSTGVVGDVGADADAEASVDAAPRAEDMRIDAAGAGAVGIAVDQGTLRLTGIASNAGWTGALTADSDTELIVTFAGTGSAEITARISLVADADAGLSVAVDIVDAAGVTTTARFDTNGNLLADAGVGVGATIDPGAGVRVGGTVDGGAGVDTDAGVDAGVDTGVDTELDTGLDAGIGTELDLDGVVGGAVGGVDDGINAGLGGTVGVESDTTAGVEVGGTSVDTQTDVEAGVDVGGTVDSTIDGLGAGLNAGAGLGTELHAQAKSGISGLLGS